MKKLTNEEWYSKLNQIKVMVGKPHKEYEVQLILADLYWTLAEGFVWELPKMFWREHQIKKVVRLHKNCCDLD